MADEGTALWELPSALFFPGCSQLLQPSTLALLVCLREQLHHEWDQGTQTV